MPLRTTFAIPSLSSVLFFLIQYMLMQTDSTGPHGIFWKKMFSRMSNNGCAMAEEMTSCSSETPVKKFPLSVYLHLNLASYSHCTSTPQLGCNPGSWTRQWSVKGKLEIISLRLCPSHILMQWKKLPTKHNAEFSEQCMPRLPSGSTRVWDI